MNTNTTLTETQKLRVVGKVLRAADPDTAKMLRAEGRGGVTEMGRYVYEVDQDQFDRIIYDYLEELAYLSDQACLDIHINLDQVPDGTGR